MARPRKQRRILPPLDPVAIESALLSAIEGVDHLDVPGDEKKARAIAAFAKWLDKQIKLPWYLEPFDGPAIKAALTMLHWLVGGWMESVFQRWKAKQSVGAALAADKLVDIAVSAAESAAVAAEASVAKPKKAKK